MDLILTTEPIYEKGSEIKGIFESVDELEEYLKEESDNYNSVEELEEDLNIYLEITTLEELKMLKEKLKTE